MKNKHFLFIFTIVLTSIFYNNLLSQDYHPFPEENAFWTVREFNQYSGFWDTFVYTISGDTTLNNHSYKIVYQLNDTPDGHDTIWQLHAFMRQEVDNKKVFFVRYYLGESEDKLGYDFNADFGDTISLPAFAYDGPDSLFVRASDPFDTIQLWNGEYRNHYLYGNLYHAYSFGVTEGIGEYRCPVPNLYYFHQDLQSEVTCFRLNGEYLFGSSPEPTDCDFTLKVQENSNKSDIIIFPNPAKDFTILSIPSGLKNVTFMLIDLVGGIVYQKSFESPSTNKILLNSYHSGVYLAVIESNGLKQSVKLIIE